MSLRDDQGYTPMKKLIRKAPEAAMVCFILILMYNLEHIVHLFVCWFMPISALFIVISQWSVRN